MELKEKIIELISRIDDDWILIQIVRFIRNMTS